MEFVVSPHITFCYSGTGFNVLFLAVLRSSKVMVLFLFTFILSFLIFGPFLVQAVSRAFTLLCSAPLCLRAFAIHRPLVDPEEERTLPSSSHCSTPPLSAEERTVHLQMRFRICQFFKSALTESKEH